MLKKIIIYTGIILLMAAQTAATAKSAQAAPPVTRIAVVVKTSQFHLSPESRNYLSEKLRALFPAGHYQLVEDENFTKTLERELNNRLLYDPTDIERGILLDLTKKYRYDASLIIFIRFDKSGNNNNFLNLEKDVQTTIKGRMVYKKTGDYIYNNDITRVGVSPMKTFKAATELNDVISKSVNLGLDHLFSDLELPLAKRTIELNR